MSSLLSLELGRPAMIKEEDCDVQMPNPVDDQYIHEGGDWMRPTASMATSQLLPTIHVIGGIARLLGLLKNPQISKHALRAYDAHFDAVMKGFPANHKSRMDEYIDPVEAPPMMYLQNARLMLHRHNLSPICNEQTRSQAIDGCSSVGRDTARLLRRCMREPPSGSQSKITANEDPWEKRMVSASSAFFCTHIWRCTLYLCFRQDFEAALTCVKASSILGDSRRINTACGRYLDFFLGQLVIKMRQGVVLDQDEEMIAYVSADLQGSLQGSWIWQESKGRVHLGRPLQSASSSNANGIQQQELSEATAQSNNGEWAGWDKIASLIRTMAAEQRKSPDQQRAGMVSSTTSPVIQLPPLLSTPSPSTSTPRDRMSIKDLL